MMFPSITELQGALSRGETTSYELTTTALQRIQDPKGQGSTTFLEVQATQALAAAKASDLLRSVNLVRSPLEGLPISIKDLFDQKGEVTRGASLLLKDAPAATDNALLIQRLLNAGAIIIGRTNMTEFAFSGLGINPHYGTPHSLWDATSKRIPGGSSSGAGVSVAAGMAVAAIGTDTGGSIRIPAAFNALTGFKPTAARIPSEGVMPLANSLDSSGPLALTVECCAMIDAVLSGQSYVVPQAISPSQLRLAMPTNLVFDELDLEVENAIAKAIARIEAAGVTVERIEIPEFNEFPYINRLGGLVCAEAWANHRDHLAKHTDLYDPRVAMRMKRGADQDAADYLELLSTRERWSDSINKQLLPYDAIILPTTALVAPKIDDLKASDEVYFAINGLILRNASLINFLNGCALSLPCHREGEAPVGLMLAAPAMHDHHLLKVGSSIEAVLASLRYA